MTESLADWPLVIRAGFGSALHAGRWEKVQFEGREAVGLFTRCGRSTSLFLAFDQVSGPTCRRCLRLPNRQH